MAKSQPRKVKVCFSFALGSQPFMKIYQYYIKNHDNGYGENNDNIDIVDDTSGHEEQAD